MAEKYDLIPEQRRLYDGIMRCCKEHGIRILPPIRITITEEYIARGKEISRFIKRAQQAHRATAESKLVFRAAA